MNQGKLDVVKQEIARVNIDILEISELKWKGMGEFNSDDRPQIIDKSRTMQITANAQQLRPESQLSCSSLKFYFSCKTAKASC